MAGSGWACFSGKPSFSPKAVGIAFLPDPGGSPSSREGEQQTDLNGLLPEGHLYCRDAAESITLILSNNSVRSAGYTISHMRKLRIREVESLS